VNKCEFRQKSKPLASYVQAEYAQGIRAENKTNSDEHNRATDPGPLDTSGDRAVDEQERGQYRGILVHRGTSPEIGAKS
jgi:hypothetical protein